MHLGYALILAGTIRCGNLTDGARGEFHQAMVEKVAENQKQHTNGIEALRLKVEDLVSLTQGAIPSDGQLAMVAEKQGEMKSELVKGTEDFMKRVDESPNPSPRDKELSAYAGKSSSAGGHLPTRS